ncbi:MAG: hypothetical protein WD022_00110, partial [Balneolaceae bacterium]
MKNYIIILLSLLLASPLAFAQTPQRIHDVRAYTDSLDRVQIFFKVLKEFENGYFQNNIYRYDVSNGVETLFLEEYFDDRYGFELKVTIP